MTVKSLMMVFLPLVVALSVQSQETARESLFGGIKADNRATVSLAKPVELPADHQPHWSFQIEWWYLTLLLEDDSGKPFNYQFTLFKFAQPSLQSNWGDGFVWMGHSSLHTISQHYFAEKFAQQGTDIAGFELSPLRFFIDNWQWEATDGAFLLPATLSTTAQKAQLYLKLSADKPFVKHGEQGVSLKTADGKYRSYYYSQPFINAEGSIKIDDNTHQVTGIGWYDHEWTSQLADEDALGWDWFSLHFDDGRKLMAFTMHVNDSVDYTTGSLIQPDGSITSLTPDAMQIVALEHTSVAGRTLPLMWKIQVPEENIDIVTTPFKPDQYNRSRFPYYEGAMRFSGSHTGKGFMELTGY